MTPETIERLKRAGFPINIQCEHHPAQLCECYDTWEPTFEELANGCGSPLYLSSPYMGAWYAKNALRSEAACSTLCENPREAAAILWLLLHGDN